MVVRMDGRTDRNTLMQDFISGKYTGKHFSLNFKILRSNLGYFLLRMFTGCLNIYIVFICLC